MIPLNGLIASRVQSAAALFADITNIGLNIVFQAKSDVMSLAQALFALVADPIYLSVWSLS
jgi:hypothetical protein